MAQQITVNPITREERIVVVSSHLNDYGDLVVTDKNAKTYKVGKKRERLFDLFQAGSEVALAYSTYMNKEYIADAKVVGVKLEGSPTLSAVSVAEPKPEPAKPEVDKGYKGEKNLAFALSYSKDLCVAGLIPKEEVLTWAEVFKRYLNGDLGVVDSQVLRVTAGDKVVKK